MMSAREKKGELAERVHRDLRVALDFTLHLPDRRSALCFEKVDTTLQTDTVVFDFLAQPQPQRV